MKKITDYDIQELVDASKGEGFSPEQTAGVAVLLSKYRAEIDTALEHLKKELRSIALNKKVPDQPSVVIAAEWGGIPRGHVQVSFSPTKFKLQKGLNKDSAVGLEDLLVEKITLLPIKGVAASLLSPEYSHLREHFIPSTPTPRVGFRDTLIDTMVSVKPLTS